MGELADFKVPELGENVQQGDVTRVLVNVGDKVRAEQSLITVESDKASMEIPSSHAGVVKDMQLKLGDKVNEGSVVLMLEAAAESAPAAAPAAAGAAVPGASASVATPAAAANSGVGAPAAAGG